MVRVSTPRLTTGPQLHGGPENLQRSVATCTAGEAPASPSLAELRPVPMARTEFFSYSMGHIMNDMMASCWFSYLLVYLTKTPEIALHSEGAAGVLLSGQVADAIATPLVGVFSDKSKGCGRFGRRKWWYLGGTLLAAICFFLVFGNCLPCTITDGAAGPTVLLVYYCAAASLFNVGWAAVQVSHMAMVPELSVIESERVSLNSARYAFTVLSNVAVFVIFFGLIQVIGKNADGTTPYKRLFHLLCYASLGVGTLASLFFLFGSEERIKCKIDALNAANAEWRRRSTLSLGLSISADDVCDGVGDVEQQPVAGGGLRKTTTMPFGGVESDATSALLASSALPQYGASSQSPHPINAGSPAMLRGSSLAAAAASEPEAAVTFTSWRQWFGVREFYQVGVVYMACRLVVNVSQVLLPFYLLDFLKLSDTSITIVPLVLYLAQFLSTFSIKALSRASGRKGALALGALLVLGACAAFWFLEPSNASYVYPAIVALGVGCAIIMVVSQQLQADLVGNNTTQGAFVYGSHSFADKLSNGVAIFVVQKINGDAMVYVRQALVLVPAASILLALLFTFLLDLAQMDGGDEPHDAGDLPSVETIYKPIA